MSFILKAGAVALACVGTASATLKYTLDPSDNYAGANFFDYFDFISDGDPNNGFVDYQSKVDAESSKFGGPLVSYKNGAAYMGVDHWNSYPVGSKGRPSVRIESLKKYTHGLFVADLAHMPSSTCGLWPAFWTVSHENYPNQGEIDIIENIHENTVNLETLHTNSGCTVTGNQLGKLQSGSQSSYNCWDQAVSSPYGSQSQYQGCSAVNTDPNSYGSSFNAIGGGVYAMEWTSTAIRVWNFHPDSVPSNLKSGNPDPSSWGLPSFTTAFGNCDIDSHFKDHVAIFNTDFCGSYAGLDYFWQQTSCYKSDKVKYATCSDYVAANPSAYSDAYWLINSLKIYQQTDVTSTSSSTQGSTSTSSSSSHSTTSSTTTTTSSTSTSSSTSSKISSTTSTSTTSSSSSSSSSSAASTSSSKSSTTSSTTSSSSSHTSSTSASVSVASSSSSLGITTTSSSASAPTASCSNPTAPDCSAAIAAVPACAQPCLQTGAEHVGCAPTDFACQCTSKNYGAIQANATICVTTACPSSLWATVLTNAGAVCKCVNGPGVCSSSSSSSSVVSSTTSSILSSSVKSSSSSTAASSSSVTSGSSSAAHTSISSSSSVTSSSSSAAHTSTSSSSSVKSSVSSNTASSTSSTAPSTSSASSSASSVVTESSSSSYLAASSSTSAPTVSLSLSSLSSTSVPTFSLSLSSSVSGSVPTYSVSISSSESTAVPSTTCASSSSGFTSSRPWGNYSTSTTAYSTSTVYSTSVYTITSCAPSVTNCPAQIGKVTTDIISLYTTICPVTATQKSSAPVVAPSSKPVPSAYTTSTVYTTTIYTITSCAPSVTNCPAKLGHVTTEVVPAYTTVCPVTAAGSPPVASHSAPGHVVSQASYSNFVSKQTGTVKPVPYSTYVPVHVAPYSSEVKPVPYPTAGEVQSGVAGGVKPSGVGAGSSSTYPATLETNGAGMKRVGGGFVVVVGVVLGALLL